MRVSLLGQRWTLKFVYRGALGKDRHGECDSPDTKRRTIRILNSIEGRDLLDALIHEMLHGCCWHLSEDFVGNTAKHLAWLLCAYGWYRKDDAKDNNTRDHGILIATLFHFLRGANFQYERDDWSVRAAEDIARVLWRLNYRLGPIPDMDQICIGSTIALCVDPSAAIEAIVV